MTKEEQYNKLRQEILEKEAKRQRQIDEGYTYFDQLMEFHNNPENRTDFSLWLDEKKKSLYEMIFGKKEPKAHDEINRIMDEPLSEDIQNTLEGLVMGTMGGGGAGKAARQLVLALKGKIKGGKFVPSQPIKKGMIGKPAKTAKQSKLDMLLNKLKDNPNIGGNINRVMHENIKKHKPKK